MDRSHLLFHIKMIKCIIFDLDGTLVDTLKDLCVSTNEVFREYGYNEFDIKKYRYFVGNGIKKLIERCLIESMGDMSLLEEILYKFTINYENNCLRYASLYKNIKNLLNILKENNYLLFVNTNKNQDISIKILNKLLPNYFIKVYGINDKYPCKPNPFIINLIKKNYNLKDDEIIFVGDSNVDIITAHNANVKVIGCNYGFRGKEELMKYDADYLIDDPLEILKIINK